MLTGHLRSLRVILGQRELRAPGCHVSNVLEAKIIEQTQQRDIGLMHTELSVTLSYLPTEVNDEIMTQDMAYFFKTLRNPE